MILNVYRYRSDGRSDSDNFEHVTTVCVESFPDDQITFSERYGGDFCVEQVEEEMDEADYKQRMRLLRECPKL